MYKGNELYEAAQRAKEEGIVDEPSSTFVVHKRKRLSSTIPFGFDIDPNEPSVLVPNIELYKHIIEVRKLRTSGATLTECANYIAAHTPKKVSRMDVDRIIKRSY